MNLIKKLHLYGITKKICIIMVNYVFTGTSKFNCKIKRKLLNVLGYKIGDNTTIVGPIDLRGNLIVGKNCWVGKNLKINGNGTVIIGDNCDLGPEITFQTGGHKIGTSERRAGEGISFVQKVGSGTWVGGRVTICNETQIGKGCIIAACACVIKDVSDNTLVGGVPAREIRRLDT